MSRDEHTHPCAECGAEVPCSGDREPNHDGWPVVICTSYHRSFGRVAEVLCLSCGVKELQQLSEYKDAGETPARPDAIEGQCRYCGERDGAHGAWCRR